MDDFVLEGVVLPCVKVLNFVKLFFLRIFVLKFFSQQLFVRLSV